MNHPIKASVGLQYRIDPSASACAVTGKGACKDKCPVIPESIDGYSVTEIAAGAFADCKKLSGIVIPASVTVIGADAFAGCTGISSIQFNGTKAQWNHIEKGDGWREGSSIRIVTLNAEQRASKNIAQTLPQTKTLYLDPSQGLQYRVNPDGKTCTVTAQGSCPDKDVIIPDAIDGYLVTEIVTETRHTHGFLISGFHDDITSVIVSDTVTSIGESAFAWCRALARAVIPDSVGYIGENAFPRACELLVSPSNPHYASDGDALFTKDMKTLLRYSPNGKSTVFAIPDSVTEIGNAAFMDCAELTGVTVPPSVTAVGKDAFRFCKSLRAVVLPDSVTVIGETAFYGCKSLTLLSLPASLAEIGNRAFSGCEKLSTIRYGGKKKQWKEIRVGRSIGEFSALKKIECTGGAVKYKE